MLNICLITYFEITSSSFLFQVCWNLHEKKWFTIINAENQYAGLWLTLLEEMNLWKWSYIWFFGFFFWSSSTIWCSIFAVFKSFYKLLKIWSHIWYFPSQTALVNILLISLLGFLRRGRKNILKAEECSGLEGEQWLANIFHFNSCSRSLTSLCVFFVSVHLLFRQLPEYMFIAHRRENPPNKMWH